MGKGTRMGMEWHGDETPYTGKSEIFKPEPAVPRAEIVYSTPEHRQFLIVRDPLMGLNTCQGETDEKGWPILRGSDA